jgi:protein-S-isoprenylcysteine O-methyltransferase Ste14
MTAIGIRLSPDFSKTGLWDFFLRVVLGLYFGWNGLSAADMQVRSVFNEGFEALSLSRLLEILSDMAGTLFMLGVAILMVTRHRRVAASAGFYPRMVAMLGSFLFAFLVPFLTKQALPPALNLFSISLMLAGSVLAATVLMVLGRSFSIFPEARRLVVTGPYRFVRHPLYATEFIALFGLALQYRPWPAMAAFLIQLYFLAERMRIEEEILHKTFPEYKIYAARVERLLPGIW